MHQIGASARIDTENLVALLLNVGLNTRALSGSSFDITTRLSTNPYLDLVYSYAAPRIAKFNVRNVLRYTSSMHSLTEASRYNSRFLLNTTELYFSNIHVSDWELNLGLRNQYYRLFELLSDKKMEYSTLPSVDFPSLFLKARVETLDNTYFPKKGISAGVRADFVSRMFETNPASKMLAIAMADVTVPITFGNFTLTPSVAGRIIWGKDIPLLFSNIMGGDMPGRYIEHQFPFVGFNGTTLLQDHMFLARLDASYQVAPNHFLSLIGNATLDFDSFQTINTTGVMIYGTGLGYGYNSIAGPLRAQVFWSTLTKKVGLYLSFGYTF